MKTFLEIIASRENNDFNKKINTGINKKILTFFLEIMDFPVCRNNCGAYVFKTLELDKIIEGYFNQCISSVLPGEATFSDVQLCPRVVPPSNLIKKKCVASIGPQGSEGSHALWGNTAISSQLVHMAAYCCNGRRGLATPAFPSSRHKMDK